MFALASGMLAQMPHNIWPSLNMKEAAEMITIVLVPFLKAVFVYI